MAGFRFVHVLVDFGTSSTGGNRKTRQPSPPTITRKVRRCFIDENNREGKPITQILEVKSPPLTLLMTLVKSNLGGRMKLT